LSGGQGAALKEGRHRRVRGGHGESGCKYEEKWKGFGKIHAPPSEAHFHSHEESLLASPLGAEQESWYNSVLSCFRVFWDVPGCNDQNHTEAVQGRGWDCPSLWQKEIPAKRGDRRIELVSKVLDP
jgi:hypothetical protein